MWLLIELEMRDKWILASFILFWSCEGDFFPPGLYDYQVERLLTGGDSKVWDLVVDSDDCADSMGLYMVLLSDSEDDSVAISSLVPSANCSSMDTIFIGNADASRFIDRLLFTDSLIFENGDYWLIQSITSSSLQVEAQNILRYRSD